MAVFISLYIDRSDLEILFVVKASILCFGDSKYQKTLKLQHLHNKKQLYCPLFSGQTIKLSFFLLQVLLCLNPFRPHVLHWAVSEPLLCIQLPCVCVCVLVCTNRQVGEDTEGALQKSDQVNQVVAGGQVLASRHRGHPVVIGELQELVDLCVQAGVDLCLCGMTSILQGNITGRSGRYEDINWQVRELCGFMLYGRTKKRGKGGEKKKGNKGKSTTAEQQSVGTLKVEVPYSLVALTVSGGTLVMFDMNSSKKWQLCSRWVVLMITCTNCTNRTQTFHQQMEAISLQRQSHYFH